MSHQTVAGKGAVAPMAQYPAQQFKSAGFTEADIEMVPVGDSVGMIVRYRGVPTAKEPVLSLR